MPAVQDVNPSDLWVSPRSVTIDRAEGHAMPGTDSSGSRVATETAPDRAVDRAVEVCGRDRALLRAVAAGRCQLRAGCEPQLIVDGLSCADSAAARRLIVAGLIASPAATIEQARLTSAGRAALALVHT